MPIFAAFFAVFILGATGATWVICGIPSSPLEWVYCGAFHMLMGMALYVCGMIGKLS